MANFHFNKVILGGRLTADPELKQTPQGNSVATFSIAVERKGKGDGESQTDFINCVAWRNTADFISKYFKKGSSICVVGQIQTRTWTDQQGQKRYITEVIIDEANFVDSKSESGTTANNASKVAPKKTKTTSTKSTRKTVEDDEDIEIDEDDLPF